MGEQEDASCRGKAGYLTWEAAHRVVGRATFKPNRKGRGRVSIYRCRFCSMWHVGSSSF